MVEWMDNKKVGPMDDVKGSQKGGHTDDLKVEKWVV